jgi:hypothetical protein
MIDLYAFDTPNARKITVALEEMGLPYAVHIVDIGCGEQFAPDFLAISPNNKIPAIVDRQGPDGAPLSVFESGAILWHLAQRSGRFLPADPRRRVAALEWLMFQVGGFGPIPGQVHHFVALQDEAARAYALERFQTDPQSRGLLTVSPVAATAPRSPAAPPAVSSSPMNSASPTSRSWVGPGATNATVSTWPTTRRCSAGTVR